MMKLGVTDILGMIPWYFWLMIIALPIIKNILSSPKFKGRVGESFVNLSSRINLDKTIYKSIYDVTLPVDDSTTQIDHIILSPFGVFVIETKNYKGWIFANENNKNWKQIIYKESNFFQNPIHQNYKHVQVVKKLLNLNDHEVFSVVAFVGDCEFKTDKPEGVFQGNQFIDFILSKQNLLFTDSKVTLFQNKIEYSRLKRGKQTNEVHLTNLNKQHNLETTKTPDISEIVNQDNHENRNIPLCPKCNSIMQLRTAKQGKNAGNQFWGCSQYPKCKGIVNIKN